jgi:hypothetical protein
MIKTTKICDICQKEFQYEANLSDNLTGIDWNSSYRRTYRLIGRTVEFPDAQEMDICEECSNTIIKEWASQIIAKEAK